MKFVLKTRNCVLKTMNFVLKTINFAVVDQLEDDELAEALQLSIEAMGGEDFEGEDEDESAEMNKKWQELSNLQSTLRSFSHVMTAEQLEKAHATEDGLHSALGLDAIPRATHRKQTALVVLPSGHGGGKGGKGKGKGKGKPAQSPRSAQDDDDASLRLAERLNAEDEAASSGSEASEQGLTDEEERTTMRALQDFNLGIDELYLVQIQRKQARGEAFTDVAELVTEVINYIEMKSDTAFAHALSQQDEMPAREPQRREGGNYHRYGIKDSESDSESSDEEARARRRRARVTQKPKDRFRLPGAAGLKPEPGRGALVRSLEHEQFYEDLGDQDAWQFEVKRKTAQYNARVQAMQHKWNKQNTASRSGGQQTNQHQHQQQNSPQRNRKAPSSPSCGPLWIPPPPDSQPPSAEAGKLKKKNLELQKEIERMRRHQQQQQAQVEELRHAHVTQSQRPHSQATAAAPAVEGTCSWLHTARKDTAADPTLLFGGAGAPPPAIVDAAHQWPFLQRYIVECLITTGKTTWNEIDPMLADSLRRPSLLPLERFLKERWSWLPPQPDRHNFVFTASVSLKNGELKWELRWPELVSRRETTATGFTKRNYEYYGHENLLFVDIPGGDHGVAIAKQLRKCAPSGGRGIRMLGRRWNLLACRPESGSKKPQMVLCSAHDKMQNDVGVYDTWHLDPIVNVNLSIAKSLARENMAMSSVISTVEVPEKCIEQCTDGLDEMADGACGISRSLFTQAWECYCENTMTEDTGVMPSVLQARIRSNKGVWYIDDRLQDGYIQFRENQNKWLIPSPTAEQLTLEVCCFGTDSGPARLNLQMIRLLELRMATPDLLAELLTEQLENDAKALTSFEHCERFCRDGGDKGEAVLEKLRSGWRLDDEIVQALLRKSMVTKHRRCIDENKLHIRLKQSRDYIIIPDPFAVLEPDEVVAKIPGIGYLQADCIMGRSPCYAPGELLACRAVHFISDGIMGRFPDAQKGLDAFKWFEAQQCVVILSTKPVGQAFPGPSGHSADWNPTRNVADLMQGGDYDGDNVKLIWDERFVREFKPFEPIVYTDPINHPRGSLKIRDVPTSTTVDDVAFEYFLDCIRGRNHVGEISTLHENWCLQAAGNWNSPAGDNCKTLADLAQKGLDAVSAGYKVTIPEHLKDVDRSSYRRRSSPAMTAVGANPAGEDVFTVWVGPLEPTVKSDTLEDALKSAYGMESVCESWIPATQDYGFVGFKSKQEQRSALCKTVMLHGKEATIREDTSGQHQKQTTGVMDTIWAAYSRFTRVSLAALDNDVLFIPPDPEVEEAGGSDPAAHTAVERELGNVCRQMALAHRDYSTADGAFHDRMDQIKHDVKLKLVCKHGLQRDLWASAWYTQLRLRLNRDLKQWDRSENGRQAGVERPYPKLWINEIFGKDWDYMKAKRLPPQRTKRSGKRGTKTRYRHRGKVN